MQDKKTNKRFNVKENMKLYWEKLLNIEFLEAEQKELEREMAELEPISSPNLTGMPRGGGTSDPTAKMAIKMESINKKIKKVKDKIWQEEHSMRLVDCLIQTQAEEDQYLLELRVKKRARWEKIQDEMYSKYNKYTHFKSIERRYNDLLNRMQQKIDQKKKEEENK